MSIPTWVKLDDTTKNLDVMLRINLVGAYLIQHNVQVRSDGFIHRDSVTALTHKFLYV